MCKHDMNGYHGAHADGPESEAERVYMCAMFEHQCLPLKGTDGSGRRGAGGFTLLDLQTKPMVEDHLVVVRNQLHVPVAPILIIAAPRG